MTKRTAASITRDVTELRAHLPKNVWVTAISPQMNRTEIDDKASDDFPDFPPIYMSAEKPYIKSHREKLGFPLYYNGGKSWDLFASNLKIIIEKGLKYDPNIAEKIYLSNIVLARVPPDYVKDDKFAHTPSDLDDSLYDDVPLTFLYFLGTDKFIHADLGKLSPNRCSKTADLVRVEITKTKRARGDLLKRPDVRCWITKDIHIIEGKELRNPTPEFIKSLMPELWRSDLVRIRECKGEYKMPTTFITEECKQFSIHNEIHGEYTEDEKDTLKSMKNND